MELLLYGRPKIKKYTWRRLSKKFDHKTILLDNNLVAAGNLHIKITNKWLVQVNAAEKGLVIKRLPWEGLHPNVNIAWSEIGTVTEYDSGIRRHATARTQTYGFVTFRCDSTPDIMMPWCTEFTDLLPESVGYLNRKNIFWKTALKKNLSLRD